MITMITLTLLAASPQGPKAGPLVKDLQAKDAAVRIKACNRIEHSPVADPKVIHALLAAKEHATPPQGAFESVNHHAGRALVACGAAAVPVCIEGLDDRALRMRAAGALAQIRPVDPRTLPALRKCLADHPAQMAENCGVVIAIGALGADGRDAVPDLIALATSKTLLKQTLGAHPSGLYYGNVLSAFGMIGPDAHAAIPTLLTLTATEPGSINAAMVRRLSIRSIGQIGFGPEASGPTVVAGSRTQILAALRRLRGDPDRSVVEEADKASALLDPDYDAPAEARRLGLRHQDARIRLQTCQILAAMGRKAAAARKWLEGVADQDADQAVRTAAAAALQAISG